jgi:hypothetical protein
MENDLDVVGVVERLRGTVEIGRVEVHPGRGDTST